MLLDAFHEPRWLALLALAPVLWWALYQVSLRRDRRLDEMLGGRTASLTTPRTAIARHLVVAGVILASVAAAQPTWGEPETRPERKGVDILVCLDVSRSMLARDVAPDRLTAARRAIHALAERTRGDRLGLVAFAGEARLVVPLTTDTRSFRSLVDQTDTLTVEKGGTDLGAALETALDALVGATGDHETVLLVTDGEDIEERGRRVAERLASRSVAVHTIGFGSALGSKIVIDVDGRETYLRDVNGEEVISALDPGSLERIAAATGGAFVHATDGGDVLVDLYDERVLPMAEKAQGDRERRERPNRYQWPLAGVLALWILNLCVTRR